MILAAVLALLSPTVELDAVGDVMLARWVQKRIEREGVDAPFRAVAPILRRADLTVGNLECVIGTASYASSKRINLRTTPKSAAGLWNGGFALMTLANNHAMDCGAIGLVETEVALRDRRISWTGRSLVPTILVRNGVRISFLGACEAWADVKGPVAPRGASVTTNIIFADDPRFLESVRRARNGCDIVVVMLHWGQEGSPKPSAYQTDLAAKLADNGADLVIGSHPHVLQPIEWIPGPKGRRCLVAYSLGNFIFDARPGPESQSEILRVRLTKNGLLGFAVQPVQIQRGFPTIPDRRATLHPRSVVWR